MTDIRQPVIVITGATSGIGSATAHAFAKRGMNLVLAARGEADLVIVADECRNIASTALFCSVDVGDPKSADAIRDRAVKAFGCIDVWINCAAVLVLGRFEEIPLTTIQRTIETNLFGYIYGSRAALTQFRAQGARGILINVGSVLGLVGEPYASIYVSTKFAIRGLTTCLRQEARNLPNLHVCTVLPAAIDTPIYQNAANYMGREARSIFPVYDADRVALAIVRLVDKPRREVVVGGFGRLLILATKLAPGVVEWAIGTAAPTLQFKPVASEPTSGNVSTPVNPHNWSAAAGTDIGALGSGTG